MVELLTPQFAFRYSYRQTNAPAMIERRINDFETLTETDVNFGGDGPTETVDSSLVYSLMRGGHVKRRRHAHGFVERRAR